MHVSRFCITFCLVSLFLGLHAQQDSYHISRTFQKAISKQTRSSSGLPGKNYWQNESKYIMKVDFEPETGLVNGIADIAYFNNSPDTLKRLVFNLYQDILRKGNSRDWDLGTDDLHDGTLIRNMKINDNYLDMNNSRKSFRQGTKLIVLPDEAILPGDSVNVSVSWEVKIPTKRTVRMGKYSDSVFFVAYWYPQIAVYDDIDGWDMISYGGSVEFYNDFNDYEVEITVPGNFGVWATGLLQNPDEVFHKEIVARYFNAWESDQVIPIITAEDYSRNKVFISSEKLSFKFKAESVPDFSFGIGAGMLWDAVSVEVDKNTKRRILADAVYSTGDAHYENVAEYSKMSVNYMSKVTPGVPFPYPQMTTFSSGRKSGGMESPMMAINGAPDDAPNTLGLTFHEIAHTYMPFFMGTNEKKYAWMDEGWATLWPHVLVDSIFPDYRYLERTVAGFEAVAGFEMDIPPMVPNHLLGAAYPSLRLGSYVRPAMAYHFLENALGADAFSFALKSYMHFWQGLHPSPLDFFKVFEMAADQDLYWFFKPWFYENAYPDLSIRKITKDKMIVIENTGGLPLPVYLEMFFTDGSKEIVEFNTSIWNNGDKTVVIQSPEDKFLQEVRLGNKRIPDVNKKDNVMLLID